MLVEVEHELFTARGLALRERQAIVYRDDPAPASAAVPLAPEAPVAAPADADWEIDLFTSTTTLFRYSALIFSGHRIHYDRDHARNVEGYPRLLVQGGLQAARLPEPAAKTGAAPPARFAFKGLAPLFDAVPCRLCLRDDPDAGATLWFETGDGRHTVEASVQW